MMLYFAVVFILDFKVSCKETQYMTIGSSATIRCPFKALTAPLIWRGPPMLSILTFNENTSNETKFTAVKEEVGMFHLQVKNVTKSDIGHYQCSTVVKGFSVEFDVMSKLPVAPKSIQINGIRNDHIVHFVEGQMINLECKSDLGIPKGTIRWENDTETIILVNSSDYVILRLKTHRLYHLKHFRCVVDNGFFVLRRTVQFKLVLAPRVTLQPSGKEEVNEGEDLRILCKNDNGSHGDIFTWTFEDRILIEQQPILWLLNITKSDSGQYICKVSNDAGDGRASVNLLVKYKPSLVGHHSVINVEGKLGTPAIIIIVIETFIRPRVKWDISLDGLLGGWNIRRKGERTFAAASTIVPTTRQHIGNYTVKVLNNIGKLRVLVKLHESIYQVANASGSNQYWNATSDVSLQCQVESLTVVYVEWFHVLHGNILQTLSGNRLLNGSSLTIKHCNYEDTGQYVCVLSTDTEMFSVATNVTIQDKPVLSQKIVTSMDGLIKLSLLFYSLPQPEYVLWLKNNELVTDGFKSALSKRMVYLQLYNSSQMVNGFVADLTFPKEFYNNSYTCRITNFVGKLDILFDNFSMKQVFKNLTDLDRCWFNNEICEPYMKFIFVSAVVLVVILTTIVITVTRCRQWCSGLSAKQSRRAAVTLQTTNSAALNDRSSDQGYEEIEMLDGELHDGPNNLNQITLQEDNEGIQDETISLRSYENVFPVSSYEDLNQSRFDIHKYETFDAERM